MPLTIEQLRGHLLEAEQHIAECEFEIAHQRQVVQELSLKNQSHEEAVALLEVLEDTRHILEQHRELIRSAGDRRAINSSAVWRRAIYIIGRDEALPAG